MTDEDEQKFRAMMLEVSSAVADSMRRQVMDEIRNELLPIRQGLTEIRADIELCLDRQDKSEVDREEFRSRFDALEIKLGDLKLHLVKMSREQMRDRAVRDEHEKRLLQLEKERKG